MLLSLKRLTHQGWRFVTAKATVEYYFDDNHNYTIYILHFNDLNNLMISLFDLMEQDKNGSRIGKKIGIDKVSDICRFGDRLVETVWFMRGLRSEFKIQLLQ